MTAPVTPVLPDVELIVVTYLRRDGSRVGALVDDRVYTTVPKAAEFPLLRVVRFGGGARRSAPLHLAAPSLQLDAYGGSKADARRLLDTAFAELADIAYHEHDDAVVTGITLGAGGRYLPDADYDPAKPRYSGDVTVWLHPPRGV
jgi:hypothetical protein